MIWKFAIFFIFYTQLLFAVEQNYEFEQNKNVLPLCNGNFIIVSTIDGKITALDINTGYKCWSLLVDDEEFLTSSLSKLKIFEKDHQVFLVPSLDGDLYKYDSGKKVVKPLPANVDSLISRSVYLDASTNVIGAKIKVLLGIHRLTGEVIYRCKMDNCEKFNVTCTGDIIILEEIIQFVSAIDSITAEKRWHFRVVHIKLKLASQASRSSSSFVYNNNENALIPSNFMDFINLDSYKISLQNGFVGMINKSNEDFSWFYKTKFPMTEAWYLKDNILKTLDPFSKESSFFSVNTEDGKYSTLIFLGTYKNQMFIKKSKNFPVKDLVYSSLSTKIFIQDYIFPVCSNSDRNISVSDVMHNEADFTPALENFSDHGIYFYTNFSIIENATHCIINTSYILHYENTVPFSYKILSVFLIICLISTVCYLYKMKTSKQKQKVELVLTRTPSIEIRVDNSSPDKQVSDTEFKSRFHQDFEMISVLGKGGFGIVMDARNKIDDCRYAVKRIRLSEKLNSSKYDKVLREVKALAKLDHCGIVRYFNAWIEYPPPGWQEKQDMESNVSDVTDTPFSTENKISSSDKSSNSQVSIITAISKSEKLDYLRLDDNPFKLTDDFMDNTLPFESQFSDYSSSSESDNSFYTEGITSENVIDLIIPSNRRKIQESREPVSNSLIDKEKNVKANSTTSNMCKNVESSEESSKNVESSEESSSDDSIIFDVHPKRSRNIFSQKSMNLHDSHNNLLSMEKDVDICKNVLHSEEGSDEDSVIFGNSDKEITLELNNKSQHMSSEKKCESSGSDKRLSSIKERNSLNNLKNGLCNAHLAYDTCKNVLAREESIICELSNNGQNVGMNKVPSEENECEHSNECKPVEEKKKEALIIPTNSKKCLKSGNKIFKGYLYIQMQLCQKESLRDWLNVHTTHREYKKVISLFKEIVEAVHYVHECGLMHRDLKPSNIYFSMDGCIKIGDFGLATSSDIMDENNTRNECSSATHTSDVGTKIYMSPEQELEEEYDLKTDIYSLGIIFFELLVPFETFSERCKVLLKVRKMKFPEDFERKYKIEGEFVKLLLHDDPKFRPTTQEIQKHPLFCS